MQTNQNTIKRDMNTIKNNSRLFCELLWNQWSPQIRELREKTGLSREDVCDVCNINEDQLLNVEYGGLNAEITVYFKLYLFYEDYLAGLTKWNKK